MRIGFLHYLMKRRWIVLIMALLVPVGLWTKSYEGPVDSWVNNSLGGVLYVIFWSLFFSLLFPRARHLTIALVVLFVTCALEVLQLWHPPLLESVRSTFIGATLLGNSFAWWDFPHYGAGFLASWDLLYLLSKGA